MRLKSKSVVSAAALALPLAFVAASMPAMAGSSQSSSDCTVNFPCGPTGATGATVATGATGATGPAGPVTTYTLSNAAVGTATVFCVAGDRRTGGGGSVGNNSPDNSDNLNGSFPVDAGPLQGWRAVAAQASDPVTAFVVCADL